MVYVRVDIDASDVLEEISDKELTKEVERRERQSGRAAPIADVTPQTIREADQSLDDAAFALRQIGKINLAWRLDEIRQDYFKPKT